MASSSGSRRSPVRGDLSWIGPGEKLARSRREVLRGPQGNPSDPASRMRFRVNSNGIPATPAVAGFLEATGSHPRQDYRG